MRWKQKQSLQGFMLFKDVSGIVSEKCQVCEFVEGWNWKTPLITLTDWPSHCQPRSQPFSGTVLQLFTYLSWWLNTVCIARPGANVARPVLICCLEASKSKDISKGEITTAVSINWRHIVTSSVILAVLHLLIIHWLLMSKSMPMLRYIPQCLSLPVPGNGKW